MGASHSNTRVHSYLPISEPNSTKYHTIHRDQTQVQPRVQPQVQPQATNTQFIEACELLQKLSAQGIVDWYVIFKDSRFNFFSLSISDLPEDLQLIVKMPSDQQSEKFKEFRTVIINYFSQVEKEREAAYDAAL
jgi:hypothetical protein